MAKMNRILCCLFGLSLFVFVYGENVGNHSQSNAQVANGDEGQTSTPKIITQFERETAEIEAQDEDQVEPSPKIITQFERETAQVAANLYKGVNQTEPELGNFVVSPLSLTTLMVMLNAGGNGGTAREIQHLFKFGANSSITLQSHSQVLKSLQNQTGDKNSSVELVTASRMFVNSLNANILPSYKTAVSSLGEVEIFSFEDRKNVVEKTNEWVKNQTRGKITMLVEEKDFTEETAAVLLNAVYFKAQWKQQFDVSQTQQADFHIRKRKSIPVDMMHISAEFPHADLAEVEANAIFLPYKGDRMSMVIYLPYEGKKLSSLEENLEKFVPSEIRNKAELKDVSLSLPKFNISASLELKDILISLGVPKMFQRKEADFSKMSETPEFHMSKIRQQVFMDVNEEGTEVAAATVGFGLGPSSFSERTLFHVNRPFIFQIFDEVHSAILLSGRIMNPNSQINPVESLVAEREEEKAEVEKQLREALEKRRQEEEKQRQKAEEKQKVAEILVEILNLIYSPNSTSLNEVKTRVPVPVPGLEVLMQRRAAEQEEAKKSIQNLTQTVQKLESRILELENKNQVQTTKSSINPRTEASTLTPTLASTAREVRPSGSIQFDENHVHTTTTTTKTPATVRPAAAWIYTDETSRIYVYNSTVHEPCVDLMFPIEEVHMKDNSCVVLHEHQSCKGQKKVRLNRNGASWSLTYWQNPFGWNKQPKSIGVCG